MFLAIENEALEVYRKRTCGAFEKELTSDLFMFLNKHCTVIRGDHDKDTVAFDLVSNTHTLIEVVITLRTDYSNEVIVVNKADKFYTISSPSYLPPVMNMEEALVFFAHRIFTEALSDCWNDMPKIALRTAMCPMGACIVNNKPYVYVNVVIDHTLKDDPMFKLSPWCHYRHIENIVPADDLEKALVSKLTICKKEVN